MPPTVHSPPSKSSANMAPSVICFDALATLSGVKVVYVLMSSIRSPFAGHHDTMSNIPARCHLLLHSISSERTQSGNASARHSANWRTCGPSTSSPRRYASICSCNAVPTYAVSSQRAMISSGVMPAYGPLTLLAHSIATRSAQNG